MLHTLTRRSLYSGLCALTLAGSFAACSEEGGSISVTQLPACSAAPSNTAPASDTATAPGSATVAASATAVVAAPPGVFKVCERPESAAFDADSDAWYVSCQIKADMPGDGYVVKLNADANAIVKDKLVVGLDEPKGIAFNDGKLYVSNVTELVTANLADGTILQRTSVVGLSADVPAAPFLNDVAVDAETGDVYVSDNRNNLIFRFDSDGKAPVVFATGPQLEAPNGLLVDRRDTAHPQLLVASMGPGLSASKGVTDKLGTVYAIGLTDEPDAALGTVKYLTPRVGNLDGLVLDGDELLITDFFAGRLMRVAVSEAGPVFNENDAQIVRQSFQRAADVGIDAKRRLAVVPETNNGTVVAIDLNAP